MDRLPSPQITPLATRWLQYRDTRLNQAEHALLLAIDGQRNVVELESVARALGLREGALDLLRRAGLIQFRED
ncbi:MAG TPA: hypothetical protein VF169_12930 [Albitalea sp.]|uniref:hypothetical protein n=1 Tax=Piscinibacter sp. TaxID=1903157 RepID=UPI002ED03EED